MDYSDKYRNLSLFIYINVISNGQSKRYKMYRNIYLLNYKLLILCVFFQTKSVLFLYETLKINETSINFDFMYIYKAKDLKLTKSQAAWIDNLFYADGILNYTGNHVGF